MATAITESPDLVRPVRGPIVFTAADTANTIVTYNITVTIDSETSELEKLPDPDNSITIDISSILTPFFEDQVHTHTGLTSTFTDGLKSYTITFQGNYDGGDSSVTSGTFYVFNGTEQANNLFDFDDYRPRVSGNVSYLSDWTGYRSARLTDTFNIQHFEGTFGADTAVLDSLTVTETKRDGTTNTATLTLGTDTTPKIRSINISPASITSNTTLTINSDTRYYELSSSGNRIETIRVNIEQELPQFSPYRIAWVNSFGTTDYFTITNNSIRSVDIDRDDFTRVVNHRRVKSYFNTQVVETVAAYTRALSWDESQSLQTLWYSRFAVSIENGSNRNILIDADTIQILPRLNGELRIYGIEFEYADALIA